MSSRGGSASLIRRQIYATRAASVSPGSRCSAHVQTDQTATTVTFVVIAFAFLLAQLDAPMLAWVLALASSREARIELWTIVGVAAAVWSAIQAG